MESKRSPRPIGWQERLNGYIESKRHVPFAWGTHDCGSFFAHAVEAVTGTLPAKEILGTYTDEAGALAAIQKATGKEDRAECMLSLPEALGFKAVPVRLAQRGDIVLVDNGLGGTAFGIVSLDARLAVSPGRKGISFTDMKDALAAWSVS